MIFDTAPLLKKYSCIQPWLLRGLSLKNCIHHKAVEVGLHNKQT